MFARLWSRGTNSSASREATAYLFQMFWYLGQGTTKEWSTLYYFYFVLMHAFICIFLPITFTLSYIYEYDKITTVQLLTSLQAFFNVWGIPAKVLTMFMLMKRLRQSLLLMDILDARCQLPEEYEKLKECAVVGNRLTVFYVTFYSLYVVATLTTSVIMGKPPYSLFIPLMDWRNSRREFVAQAVIEFIIVNVACLHQAVDDVYAVIYVYVIRKHLHILVERVKRLGLTSHQQNLPLKDADYYQQLVLCVKDHQLLLRLVYMISPVISITLFVQFAITAFILGTTLINILLFADTFTQISSAVYLVAVLVQISPCCYQATCLIEDSLQLSLAIFHCQWFDKDIRFRRLLIYFLMRSQTPIRLYALKLFPITLSASVSIAKFSFSLYTFIKQLDFSKHVDS